MRPFLPSVCRILSLLVFASILAACSAPGTSISNGTAAAQPAAPVPEFSHIFVIVLENRAYDDVIGNKQDSYINTLARQYAIADQYYGVAHPSLPNYLALLGGDTFGINSDCTNCFVNEQNLIDQIEGSGRSWGAYQESMPHACFTGDAPPLYRQKHNPFIYFDNVRNNPARCEKIVPFTQFASDLSANTLPNFVWITPNMCSDTHDCSSGDGDTWLKTWVPQILSSPAWRNGGALFITFDEGKRTVGGPSDGGHLATLVISPLGKPGFRSATAYDHYALLRTVERAWGLPELKNAGCNCTPTMGEFFMAQAPPSSAPAARQLPIALTR